MLVVLALVVPVRMLPAAFALGVPFAGAGDDDEEDDKDDDEDEVADDDELSDARAGGEALALTDALALEPGGLGPVVLAQRAGGRSTRGLLSDGGPSIGNKDGGCCAGSCSAFGRWEERKKVFGRWCFLFFFWGEQFLKPSTPHTFPISTQASLREQS